LSHTETSAKLMNGLSTQNLCHRSNVLFVIEGRQLFILI